MEYFLALVNMTSGIANLFASSRPGCIQEFDEVFKPLLNTGMPVRAIEAQANISTATVGRRCKRWEKTNRDISNEAEEGEAAEA